MLLASRKRAKRDDATLVEAIRRDHAALFIELMDRHLDGVRTFSALRTTSREWADEAVRAAFVHAFRNLGDWDPTTSFALWLQSLAADHLANIPPRTVQTETVFHTLDRILVPVPPDPELRGKFQRGIAAFPKPIRKILLLRYEKNLSVDQIAKRRRQSPGWIGIVLFRMRQALYSEITENEP
jgi:DNA-directed RNA polymerase specialized sigma24 family protein